MPFIQSSADGAQLHYVDYRPSKRQHQQSGKVLPNVSLVFFHGWPMSSRMFQHLMLVLCEDHGYRCVATDRRGFGQSKWGGTRDIEITYDTFASDTLQILKSVDGLGQFVFVASSMGCGESVLVNELLDIDPSGLECLGFVWLGPSLPHPLQSEQVPAAPSRELWDSILKGLRNDRPDFAQLSIGGVFGIAQGVEMTEAALKWYLSLIMQADPLATERCIDIITNEDFTQNLQKMNQQGLKVLILHGDSDQGMPVEASSAITQELIPDLQLKIYEKASHGLYWTHAAQVVDHLRGFLTHINT